MVIDWLIDDDDGVFEHDSASDRTWVWESVIDDDPDERAWVLEYDHVCSLRKQAECEAFEVNVEMASKNLKGQLVLKKVGGFHWHL